jgi:hypothetical protein
MYFFRNFEGNLCKNRKKSGERSLYALCLQLLFLYAFKDVKAARKPDLTVLLCAIARFRHVDSLHENGFSSNPYTRSRHSYESPATNALLRSENQVVAKCYQSARRRKFTVFRPIKK